VRLYLRDSERRPDPEPVKTDDRTAILTGLGLWIVGLVAVVLLLGGSGSPIWTCITGVVLGAALLTYAELRNRRSRRD
jgi:Protein of unknown function (DUF2530)